ATFALLAVTAASLFDSGSWIRRAVLVGTLCALAALSRTEWGLMALVASVVTFRLSRRGRRLWFRCAFVAAAVAIAEFAAVIGLFVAAAGKEAVLSDGHLLLTSVSPETRRFLVSFSHVRYWPRGLAELGYSSALSAAAVLFGLALALPSPKRRRV